MRLTDFFRHREDLPVVFSGDFLEAELVAGMLKAGGFHPYELSNTPRAYLGIAGGGRVLVPPEEAEEARAYLDAVREAAEIEAEGPDGAEAEDEGGD